MTLVIIQMLLTIRPDLMNQLLRYQRQDLDIRLIVRYYYCHVSWSADKAKLLKNVSDDYVDLRTLNDDDSAKEAILEHSKGNMTKGFVKLCKICGGCGNDNTEFVNAAEQM